MTSIRTPPSQSSDRSPAPVPSPGAWRVLLADDDRDLRDALAFLLRKRGYAVDTVSSGIGLLDRVAAALLDGARPPADAIVTDVRMPGCNGLNIAEGLRQNGWQLPIVVISAFADAEMRSRVARLPDVFLLEKPFAEERLDQLLRQTLAG